MLQISEIVKKTEEMFDLFNEHFYNMELTRPAITVSPDGGRGAYGWCSIHEIWNASGEKYREINLCAEYLDRPMTELAATLLHEMAHLYDLEHDIQDVSNNGYYHNMKFKATAEAHGLHIEKHQKYGWTVTTLAPEAETWIRETLGEAGIQPEIHQPQYQICLPLLRHHHPGDPRGKRDLRRLRRAFRAGMIHTYHRPATFHGWPFSLLS